jgi:hypothetical protein
MSRNRESALAVDRVDRCLRRHAGRHDLGRPQTEDVPVGAFDLLADDDLDAVVARDACGLKRALVGVVVADRDDRKVGLLGDPRDHVARRRGAV